jgi:hypothetical protein
MAAGVSSKRHSEASDRNCKGKEKLREIIIAITKDLRILVEDIPLCLKYIDKTNYTILRLIELCNITVILLTASIFGLNGPILA